MDLAEEKKFIPPLMERILTAKSIEFSAETKVSGIEFISNKEAILNKDQEEEFKSVARTIIDKSRNQTINPTIEDIGKDIEVASKRSS